MECKLVIKDARLERAILFDEPVRPNCLYGFKIEVPEGVTEIADDAFHSVPNLRIEALKLPKTLRRIGHRAFKKVLDSSIRSISLPSKLEFIGDEAFDSDGIFNKIKNIKVPNSVKYLGDRAFRGMESLETLTLGKGLEHIGEGIVGRCCELKSVTSAAPGTTTTDNSLIVGNKLIAVWGEMDAYTVAPEIEVIGDYAFSSCYSTHSIFGNKHYGAKEVELPSGLRRIGDFAFEELRLEELHIPENVEYVGLNPINFCPTKKLSGKYTYDGRAIIFGKHLRAHIWYAESNVIPSEVEVLDPWAFNNFRKPASITIPGTVKEIGEQCFYMAQWLKELTFEEGLERIGDEAFQWCTGLTELTFPASIKELGSETFGLAENITKIIFKGAVPPKLADVVVRDHDFKGIMRVPAESIEAYRELFPEIAKPTPAYPNGRILKLKQ